MSVKGTPATQILQPHSGDVVMGTVASQIISLTIVYSTVYSGADQRKHQNSVSLAFVRRVHRGPANSPHKWPVTRKMFPFDDVIMDSHNTMDGINWDYARPCVQETLDFCVIILFPWQHQHHFRTHMTFAGVILLLKLDNYHSKLCKTKSMMTNICQGSVDIPADCVERYIAWFE